MGTYLDLHKNLDPDFRVPGKKPVGAVEIDWNNPLTKDLKVCLPLNHTQGLVNLVNKSTFLTFEDPRFKYIKDNALFFQNDSATSRASLPGLETIGSSGSSGLNFDASFMIIAAPTESPVSSNDKNFWTSEKDSGTQDGYCYLDNLGTSGRLTSFATAGSDKLSISSAEPRFDKIPDNFAFTFNEGTDRRYLYLNGGTLAGGQEATDIRSFTDPWDDGNLQFFGAQSVSNRYEGYVYFMLLWKRTLTPEEIATLNNDPYQFLKPAIETAYFSSTEPITPSYSISGDVSYTVTPSSTLEFTNNNINIGGCVFNSSTDYYIGSSNATLQITGDVTAAITLTPSALPPSDSADWALFLTGDGETSATNVLYGLGIRNNGGTSYWSYFHESGLGVNHRVDSDIVVAGVGIQQTVVVIRDVSTNEIRFVVDGVDEGTFSYTTDPDGGSSAVMYLGKAITAGQNFLGTLSHAMVWNTELATADAQKYDDAITNNLLQVSPILYEIDEANLVSYWPITGESTEIDLAGTEDLTKNGTPTPVAFNTSFTSPDLGPTNRQGYAWDGSYHFLSDTVGLYKRNNDASWSIETSNLSPFDVSLSGTPDHIGDIAVDDTYIYAGISNYPSLTSNNLAKYLKSDLSFDSSVALATTRGTSAVAIDLATDTLYVSSFVDDTIDIYDTDLVYSSTINITPYHDAIQGLVFKNGWLYAVKDGGTLLIIDPSDGQVVHKHDLPGSYFEYEGADYSTSTFRILINEGASVDKVHFLSDVPFALGVDNSIVGDVTYTLTPNSVLDYTLNADLTGDVTITVTPAAALEYNLNASVIGDITYTITPNAVLDYTLNADLTGDVTYTLTPNSTLEYNLNAGILGDVTVSLTPNSILTFSSGNEVVGDVTYTITPNSVLDYTLNADLTGDVTITVTPNSVLLFSSGNEIVGDVTISLTPNAILDYTLNADLTGDVTYTFTPNSTLEYNLNASITGDTTYTITPNSILTFSSGNEIVGDVTYTLTPASILEFNNNFSILGDISYSITPNSNLIFTSGVGIEGDVTITVTPNSVLDFDLNASITGDVTYTFTPASSLIFEFASVITPIKELSVKFEVIDLEVLNTLPIELEVKINI